MSEQGPPLDCSSGLVLWESADVPALTALAIRRPQLSEPSCRWGLLIVFYTYV